jgi:hypothetical protein
VNLDRTPPHYGIDNLSAGVLRLKLNRPSSKLATSLFSTLLLLVCFAIEVSAQGFRVQGKSAPSVVGSGPFVSLEGRFSIALPQQQHGFTPLAIDTPVGRATGDAYSWDMKEGNFTAGYVDAALKWDEPDTTARVFGSVRDGLMAWASTTNGKLISERRFEFEKYPALEVILDFPQARLVQRFFLTSRRLYQLVLVLRPEQRAYEALAFKVLDSFNVLSETEVSEAWKAKMAGAEPSALPQEPVVARVRSDAEDDGLRGKVKSVFAESEDLSGRGSVPGRIPRAMTSFNERGNLTKRELYDYKGNLSEIVVYGYIDGARVSNTKMIRHEYDPPPGVATGPSAAGTKPKFDPRYSNKFTFKYDDQNRLIEKAWFLSNGEPTIKYVYKYSANQRENLVYTETGSLNQRSIAILDEKGNEVERTHFKTQDGSIESKYSYAYEFDSKGNWTKRTVSKWVTKDGKSFYEPSYVDYRTIIYY